MADNPSVETEKMDTAPEKAPEAAAETQPSPAADTGMQEENTPEQPQEQTQENKQAQAKGSKPSQKPKRKHKKKHYVLRIVIILAVLAAAFACAHLSYFNVNGVAVIGNEEVPDEEIIKLSGIQTGESVFDVHPLLVQHDIKKKNLYIEKVNVNRKLPDKVEIIVKERDMLAQFHKDQKFVITDSEGMVLDISKEEHKATLIEGLTVTGAEKKETIQIKETGKETEPEVSEENLPSYPAPDYDIAPGDAKYAQLFLGVPYVEGGEDENGFDNKGFVKYLYFQMFSSGFPDDYNELLYFGLKVSESKAQVSDIVCFSEGDNSELIAFCVGDGKAVYASPKEGKVVLKDISKMKVKSIRHLIDYYATSGNG